MLFKKVKYLPIILLFNLTTGCYNTVGAPNNATNEAQLSNVQQDTNNDSYLVKPNGQYGVGFKDYHYVTNICPDANYDGSNQNYFSDGNKNEPTITNSTNFCHEIMVRIYYPTNTKLVQPSTPYYQPYISELLTSVTNSDPNLTSTELYSLTNLKSWTTPYAPITNSQFPVLLFSPGYGAQVQAYENNITNLVSNGYIVVAINSIFISGNVELPNGTIVPPYPIPTISDLSNIEYPEQLNDISFTYQQIKNSNNNDPIFSQMDLSNIGGFGHSLGGIAIVNTANLHPEWFKAISTIDEGFDSSDINGSLNKIAVLPISIPILYQWASASYNLAESLGLSWTLVSKDSNSVVQTPNLQNANYSLHNNFSDLSTLQYLPSFIATESYTGQTPSDYLTVGTANGYSMQNAINAYLLPFFNTYLKKINNPLFNNHICKPLVENTILQCGPTIFPN